MKWIKIDTGIFNDSKIRLIKSMPEGNTIVVIWLQLLALAGREFPNGVFIINNKVACTDEMLATIFGEKVATVRLALKTFEDLGMIETCNGAVTLPNWNKYQSVEKFESQNEKAKERMRKYRERKRLSGGKPEKEASDEKCYVTVTSRYAVEEEEEEEEEKEINKEKAVAVKTPLSLIREFSGDNKELLESLRAWLEMRKKMKRPLTGRATQQALKKLNELSGGNQDTMVQIVDQTSLKGWLTFYPLKENKPGTLSGVLDHMNEIIPDTPEDDAATTAWLKEEGILDD